MGDDGTKRYPKQKPFHPSSVPTTSSSTASDVSTAKRTQMKASLNRSSSNDSINYDPDAYDPDDISAQDEGESEIFRQRVAFLGTDDESDQSVAYESVGAIRLDELLSSDEEGSLQDEAEEEGMFRLGTLALSHGSIQSEEIVFGGASACNSDVMQAYQDSTLNQSAISEANDSSYIGDNGSLTLRGSNEEEEGQKIQGKEGQDTIEQTKQKSTEQTKKSKQGEIEKLKADLYSWEDHAIKMANNSTGEASSDKKANSSTKASTTKKSRRKSDIEKLQDSLRSWEAIPNLQADTATTGSTSTTKRASTTKKANSTTEKDNKKPNNKHRKSRQGSEIDNLKDSLYSWEAHARRNSEKSIGENKTDNLATLSKAKKVDSTNAKQESEIARRNSGGNKINNPATKAKRTDGDDDNNKPKQESEIEKLKAALYSWEGHTKKQATSITKGDTHTVEKAKVNIEKVKTANSSKEESEIQNLKDSLNSWEATPHKAADNTAKNANPTKKPEDSTEKAKPANKAKQESETEKLKEALNIWEANTNSTKAARRASLKMEANLNWWDRTTTSASLSPEMNIEEMAHIDLEIGQEFKPINDFDISQHSTRPTLQGHELSSASCCDDEALDAITSLRAIVPRMRNLFSEHQEEKSEEVEARPRETEEELERQSQSDSSDDVIPAAEFNVSSNFRRSRNKDTDNNSKGQPLTLSALASSSAWSEDLGKSSPFAPTPEKPYGTHVVPRNAYRPTRYLTRGEDYDWDLTEEEIKDQVRSRRVLVCLASCGLILLGAAGGLMLYFLTPFGNVGPV